MAADTDLIASSGCPVSPVDSLVTSAPDEKSSPSPVTTRQRSSRRAATSRNAASISGQAWGGMAFFLAGLDRVTVTSPWRRSPSPRPPPRHYTGGLFSTPFPQPRRSSADYLVLVAALVVCAALVA